MGIQRGTQLVAPAGFEQLQAGITYYFIWSDHERERVLLVYFVIRPAKKRAKADSKGKFATETPTPFAILVAMRRGKFELGLGAGAISA
jgi:hypothetical protein